MANLIHKLFKTRSTQGLILSFNAPQLQNPLPKLTPSLIPNQLHDFASTKPDFLNHPSFFLDPKSPKDGNFTEPSKFYPNFPFGYLLNPISLSGFDSLMAMEVEEGTTETEIWADSVKKKRKKKMNKHKYKKLRKRLRRKT
ncbi:hypothetical protein E1A91_D07G064300v1 [Gossypium mustelinum]|uniref:Small ribosomal subunit protein mS38 n=5 Tax=Gossypium TaxID=3633 RepID=A0A0D2PHU7_GOSRA|nr:uncharacterized protein LOC105786663 [Gossypium raimondii]KAB2020341.1 hypothetical protein ES319_D07G062200v1 [Gossypium barbadense]TYG60398.1 hypothetical protein ES288_D07G065400v1 [Gossypium darwinii]TYH61623.1 hypothetical protein ES332_D07G065200v1 [Gossypium tomentosum]TYI72479.1 hypothetical protein E1A91_D07G064300v1 [Gossypium mustelinum]KJB06374.1 hypothetical protein B456_001G062900 [Gossypium raimondii]